MNSANKDNGNGNGSVPDWHAQFLPMLTVIRREARAQFQHLSPQERDDALAEVFAVAMIRYLGHHDQADTESYDAAALAKSAALYVSGSGRACGRESSRDVLSPTAQQQRGFTVEPLKRSYDEDRLRMRIDRRVDLRQASAAAASAAPEPQVSPSPPSPQPGFPRLLALPAQGRTDFKSVPQGNGQAASASEHLTHEWRRRQKAKAAAKTNLLKTRSLQKRLDANDIEWEAARRIQQRLFPSAAPVLNGFDIAGITYPAVATGGDYFDYVPMLDDCVGVVIGDVSGHGFGPALLMAATRAYLRAFAQTESDLGRLMSLVNRVLNLDMEEERFVSLVLVQLDPQKRSLVYASAGHPTGYVLNDSGEIRLRLSNTGLLLGVDLDTRYSATPVIALEPGELVLLLSDGVLEASAPDGEAFGWSRAVRIVRIYRNEPGACIVANLYHAVRAFSQLEPPLDDITAVVIKVGKDPVDLSLPAGAKLTCAKG